MSEYIDKPLEIAAQIVDLFGVIILLIAAIRFLINYTRFELARIRGLECVMQIRDMRLRLGSYILLALEFMIISDVINSSISRTLNDFYILALLVLIRSAFSFFLSMDLKDTRSEE